MKTIIVAAIVLMLFSGTAMAGSKPSVFVSIPPQKFFVQKIAGDLVDVSIMVVPGASPATYEPKPRQMAALGKAKAYFSIGVPFELAWLARIASANPSMAMVTVDKGIRKMPMSTHDHDAEHGHGHHEDHGILDPHVWTAPELVRTIARNTCEGLVRVDPGNAGKYRAGLDSFLKEIDGIDTEIENLLAPLPEDHRSFMVFHPSWGYFARQYHLHQIPIESEGKSPGPGQIAAIVRQGKKQGIRVVFVQPQFSAKSARVIAEAMDAKVVPLNPLAEDWSANTLHAARAFKGVLADQ